MVGLRPEKYFWTGLSDVQNKGTFQWTVEEQVQFTHWNADMPGMQELCSGQAWGSCAQGRHWGAVLMECIGELCSGQECWYCAQGVPSFLPVEPVSLPYTSPMQHVQQLCPRNLYISLPHALPSSSQYSRAKRRRKLLSNLVLVYLKRQNISRVPSCYECLTNFPKLDFI